MAARMLLPKLCELKWPNVRDMIRNETATIVFKSMNNLTPDYLSHLFNRRSDRNIINFRIAETDLQAPFMTINNGQKAFAFRGVKIWNHLRPNKLSLYFLLKTT